MNRSGRIIAGFALASVVFTASAHAQESGSTQVGNATVTVGGGTAILGLPDVHFLSFVTRTFPAFFTNRSTEANDFSEEIGWNLNGSIALPMGGDKTISLNGFWANIDQSQNSTCFISLGASCSINALVTNPTQLTFLGLQDFTTKTDRSVDQSGLALESKWHITPEVMGVTQAPNPRYFALGVDWRAIYQDLNMRSSIAAVPTADIRYNEELDTNYYGIYAAWGGDYSQFLFKNIWNRLGLQSSFRLQGGIYHAVSDYAGALREVSGTGGIAPRLNSNASDSNNEVAFIGGLTLETRKLIGQRTTLSLKSEYEYYSYVPEMKYNNTINTALFGPNVGTSIGDSDAYAMRTSLRLTIKLGPDSVFEEPLK